MSTFAPLGVMVSVTGFGAGTVAAANGQRLMPPAAVRMLYSFNAVQSAAQLPRPGSKRTLITRSGGAGESSRHCRWPGWREQARIKRCPDVCAADAGEQRIGDEVGEAGLGPVVGSDRVAGQVADAVVHDGAARAGDEAEPGRVVELGVVIGDRDGGAHTADVKFDAAFVEVGEDGIVNLHGDIRAEDDRAAFRPPVTLVLEVPAR